MLYPAELRAQLLGKSAWAQRLSRRFSRSYSTVGFVKQHKAAKTWERTRLQNLVRHKSGRYYARAFASGKEVWKSLKTSHFSVAQAKLAEFLKEHRERVSNGNGEVSAKMTFGEAAAIHLRNLDDNLQHQTAYTRLLARVSGRAAKKLARPERNRSPQDHASRLQTMGRASMEKRYHRLATTTPFLFFDMFSTSLLNAVSFTATPPPPQSVHRYAAKKSRCRPSTNSTR